MWRRIENETRDTFREVLLRRVDFDLDGLSRKSTRDEQHATVCRMRNGIAACRHLLDDDRLGGVLRTHCTEPTDATRHARAHYPRAVPRIEIAPSVLPADFARLGEEVAALEAAGVDRIHWDVMDGQFVPNLTFGPDVIAAARKHTSLPFEAHLMVLGADAMAEQYVKAGCSRLMVHVEACTHLHRTLGYIRSLGATASVVLNPSTPISSVAHVLDLVDMVLLMTVNPGFGGQKYIATMEPKIRELRTMIEAQGLTDQVDIEVDGGIAPDTIAAAAAAGANIFVAGSALFRDPEGFEHAVTDLRTRAQAAWGI